MNTIVKNIQQAYDNLPEQYKDRIEITVSSLYYDKTMTIGQEKKPKYEVYNMDLTRSKRLKLLEGIYDNEEHFNQKINELIQKYKNSKISNILRNGIHLRKDEVLRGRGMLHKIGDVRFVWN
jgi:hypothetical protein